MPFQCIPGCGLCCIETEMPLTKSDIKRIRRLGYPKSHFLVWDEKGVPRLRNIDGHCVFLDTSTMKCTIYPYRPEGCRIYPLIYVEEEGAQPDTLCPMHHTMDESDISRLKPRLMRLIVKLKREWGAV